MSIFVSRARDARVESIRSRMIQRFYETKRLWERLDAVVEEGRSRTASSGDPGGSHPRLSDAGLPVVEEAVEDLKIMPVRELERRLWVAVDCGDAPGLQRCASVVGLCRAPADRACARQGPGRAHATERLF